jgi:methylated-DNA-[protein]-cysteine S-methyltransferase
MEAGMTSFTSTLDTPAGPFTMIVDDDGSVLASGWTGAADELVGLIHSSVRTTPVPMRDLGAASRAARAYHNGDLNAPDAVAVCQHTGSAFLAAAWKLLREVGPGSPISYTELARRAGNPKANRAAAQSCARNPAGLFVPCHRIVRTDGTLGGFRWGLAVKQWLLTHERGPE